ncbi:MAG: prepilin-type N-terminal cleavage/methylation domain-containing protein [Lachnospiraceae bacterium]|nr:prepilin-type N-terminal cleavage/methylation domain-containing protein [Lachnospiraceae bacterium]
MREIIEKRKKNNKGFSLVELIIVIAIMAILVAILAPQFLKYVERSRNTADVANAREITNAVIAYIADSEVNSGISTAEVTITADGSKTTIGGDDAGGDTVLAALKEAGITSSTAKDLNDVKCKSKTTWDSYTITVKVDTEGVITFKYKSSKNGTDNSAGSDPFAAAFQQGSGTVSG